MMDRIMKLKEFLQETPDDSFLRHALALEYMKLGENEAARQCFETLLQKDENYIGSYYHLAGLLESMDLPDEARTCYEKGLQIAKEKGDRHAYNELKSAYEASGL